MIDGQMTIFGLMDTYETPIIPVREYRDGLTGWYIDVTVWAGDQGDDGPYGRIEVYARKGMIQQIGEDLYWHSIDYAGSGGSNPEDKTFFRRKPTDADLVLFAKRRFAADRRARGVQIVPKEYRETIGDDDG